MAGQHNLDLLRQGVHEWNRTRHEKDSIQPDLFQSVLPEADLSGFDLRRAYCYQITLERANLQRAILRGADLRYANLRYADLREADLSWTRCYRADFTGARMDNANLQGVDFRRATVRNAQFPGAYLRDAGFREADLTQANLNGANLTNAVFVETNLTQATIIGCAVYGVAVWSPILEGAIQEDLIITNPDESTVTVDDLEIARFLYLLLDNKKLRNILQTVTSKTVLILGRFTPERKRILDALREELRKFDLVPIIFDFDKPPSQELSETVDTLAGLARFLIADLSDPCSIPAELQRIVPVRSSLPVLPIIQESQQAYALFAGFRNYPWVLPTHTYRTLDDLLRSVPEKVIAPLIAKSRELAAKA